MGIQINHMQNSITTYKQVKPQTTKFIRNFEDKLDGLAKYLYDSSIMSLKLSQLIVQSSQNQQNEYFLPILLCQMYIIWQAYTRADSSVLSRCQKSLHQITQKVRSYIGNNQQISNSSLNLFYMLCHHTNQPQTRKIFSQFFIEHSRFIYNTSEKVWKLIIFNTYLTQQRNESMQEATTADKFLQGFKAYLLLKQKQLVHAQTYFDEQKSVTNMKELITITREEVPMSKIKQKRPSLANQQQPRYRYNITIKEIMLVQINLETIGLVEGCSAHQCPYIIFLIPFAYLLAQCLTYYQNYRELYIYHIFTTLCQRINKIKNGTNPQLAMAEIDNCIADVINFNKHKDRQLCVKLGDFVSKHKLKMSTFIPFYYQIFSFHAFQKYQFVELLFAQKASMHQRRQRMKRRIQQVYQSCSKYNTKQF